MSAEAFWACSPRAVVELYECTKAARKPAGSAAKREPAAGKPESAAPEGKRLTRIPR